MTWKVDKYMKRGMRSENCVAIVVNLPDAEICLCDFISLVSILLVIGI